MILLSTAVVLAPVTAAPASADPPPPPHRFQPHALTPLPDVWQATWRPSAGPEHRPPRRPTGRERRPTSSAQKTRKVLVRLLNRERARHGCRPVRSHRALTRAAQRHSAYMSRAGSLSHTGAHDSRPGDRLTYEGYRWRRVAENLARAERDPASALHRWKQSPKHRAVMLTCAFQHVGVGVSHRGGQGWWTLLLARPR
ncbi:CAP domain-containing protein [Streptomyces chryseus]|uniref:CAP domain-containing protein n=1 Tax=Streptomyces chryseus TaxID=68186 RepID=UPI0014774A22|nr:CAP domain-containing protein [Streptomyces chryseus]